ncbi:MAG: calcium/sodium antiporter [Candidatus Taylorbacteria bacterium]|nr:calcium/sodium antiporter [Candidatus Taylorbacteria bacterium]
MLQSILVLLVGFALLIKGADYLVTGSVSLARKYKVSNLVIGLTIVGFGTSAPELAVNLTSALSGSTDLAIGNIIGSNIANVFLILGICAIIYPLTVKRNTIWKEIPLSLLAAVITVVLANDVFFDGGIGSSWNVLSRIDGLVLLSFFIIFMYYIFGISKETDMDDSVEYVHLGKYKMWSYILGGLAALVIGGKWIVESAVFIAAHIGMSESVIGLTIVAVGTSLPELAASAVAAYRKETDIAVGNIVGSNIFNIFWILGLSAVISPLPLQHDAFIDLEFLVFSSLLLFIFLFVGEKEKIERRQGVLFLCIYAFYISTFWLR